MPCLLGLLHSGCTDKCTYIRMHIYKLVRFAGNSSSRPWAIIIIISQSENGWVILYRTTRSNRISWAASSLPPTHNHHRQLIWQQIICVNSTATLARHQLHIQIIFSSMCLLSLIGTHISLIDRGIQYRTDWYYNYDNLPPKAATTPNNIQNKAGSCVTTDRHGVDMTDRLYDFTAVFVFIALHIHIVGFLYIAGAAMKCTWIAGELGRIGGFTLHMILCPKSPLFHVNALFRVARAKLSGAFSLALVRCCLPLLLFLLGVFPPASI